MLGAVLRIAMVSITLAACEPASTWDGSRGRFVSTTQEKEDARLERRWLDKKLNQIDCRLDKLEQKPSGETTCP